jgi:hypothetical protein
MPRSARARARRACGGLHKCSDFPVLVRAQRHFTKGRDDAIGALDDARHRLAEGRERLTDRLIEGRNYVKSRLIVGRDRVQRLLRRPAADRKV